MAFFKDSTIGLKDSGMPVRDPPPREPERTTTPVPVAEAPRRAHDRAEARPEGKESFIAAELTIDGKIEGVGSVRLAGHFKGDVLVQGNLTLDAGARLTGQVKARQVTVSGELHGNIDGAQRVELLDGGVLVGDVKAGSLTVASGSRMRGQVEFGWDEKGGARPEGTKGNGSGT